MIFTSPVYSAVSGSIAGITYAHNQGGLYSRARTVPTNPNTSRQQAVKSALTAMAGYWSATLTAQQRTDWGTYAANVPVTNALGQTINLSGQNMFMRANVIRQRAALAIIADAPTVFNLGETITAITSIVVAGGTLTFTAPVGGAGTPAAGRKLFRLGPPQNAGRSYFKGPYQEGFNIAVGSAVTTIATPVSLAGADWLSLFAPAVGENIPVAFRILYDDGRLSAEHREIVTIT